MAEQFHADNGTLVQQAETQNIPEHAANADHRKVESHGRTSATSKPIAWRHSTPTAVCPTDEQEAQLVLHYHNRDVTTPATR